MKFNIVNEIKLSYSRKGNCERLILSSADAVEVFRAHFDAEEMDYRESFFALYLNQANDGEEGNRVDARLQLRLDNNGEVVLHVHRVKKRVDFRKKFLGHKFSKMDRMNLLNSGNLGRVVDLVNPVTGEMVPSLVSLDKLTNELFSLRMEFVRIPEVVCGVSLSAEQRETLRCGKPLFVENMVSRGNRLFHATLQFNAEKQWLEFFFNRKLNEDGFEWCVPATFRGVTLRRWQIEKLQAGETAYIRGLVSKKRKMYEGYMRFDKSLGALCFRLRNHDG